jgi:hypothetical protein
MARMRRHIHFIPWDLASGETTHFVGKAQDWSNSSNNGELKHNYPYTIVTSGDGTDLSALPWYSEIYIHGHGDPGDHGISSGVPPDTDLKYDTVADRLLAHGLKRSWSGAIKLYTCNSGSATLGRQSFAAKFAQYMRFSKNYHLISYVGYYGSIDGYPGYGNANADHKHKFSTRFEGTRFECEIKTKWCKVFF